LLTVLASCNKTPQSTDTSSQSTDTQTIDTNDDTNKNTIADPNLNTNSNDILHTDPVFDVLTPDDEVSIEKKYYFQRPYKSFSMTWTDDAREWGWNELSTFEKYTRVEIDEIKYFSQERTVESDLLGNYLGEYTAFGYEHIYSSDVLEYGTSIEHTEVFKVYEIVDISKDVCVAVEIENKYYVYRKGISGTPKPKTLGEFLETYNLQKTLPLNSFSYTKENKNQRYTLNDDSYIWEILYNCKDAEIQNEDSVGWNLTGNYITFTATSKQLGVYKHVFYVTENGYVETNLMEYGYHYYIGEENTKKIIDYALENAIQALNDMYEYDIVGIVTEIGDGYMLIDDSTFCINSEDGVVFRVSTSEMKIKRKCGGIDVGDIVAVFFERELNQAKNGIIDNPSTLSGCTMYDDGNLSVHARYE
ncbi:MAG: hypothetical protein IKA02_00015, partial [Clostridia bacterium]|nr:hypothetical protein [Clostridia bacterium]